MAEFTDAASGVEAPVSGLELLADDDVQRILGCSREKLRRLCVEGRVRFIKVGRSRRFKPEWVDELVESSSVRVTRVEGEGTAPEMAPSQRSAQRHGLGGPR